MDNDDDSDPFDYGGGGEDYSEERSESSDDDDEDLTFHDILQRVHRNDPRTTDLFGRGTQNITDEEWEELGRDISNNTHLVELYFSEGALNDHGMSFFFRGLTRSNSIGKICLFSNGLSVAGIRSTVPFLQNANNLQHLYLDNNNIQSEGFNVLFRALRDSPIKCLSCDNCGIELIEIDRSNKPQNLSILRLSDNSIDGNGCRGLGNVIRGNSALKVLGLSNNKIDDAGVLILVDALRNNASLDTLYMSNNDGISIQGQIMLLKLVNNISSIQATLQSNHTLRYLKVKENNSDGLLEADKEIQTHIDMATRINRICGSNPESAGREKVIQTQLTSVKRAELAHLQGVNRSLYSEFNPLHLPEVLSLIGRRHGQGEVFVALKASIIGLFSTVNMKQFIQQERAYHEAKIAEYAAIVAEHRAKIEELDAKLVTMDEAAGRNQDDTEESQSNKRRRT